MDSPSRWVVKDESIQVTPANFQWSQLVQTLSNFSAALGSTTQETASVKRSMNALEKKLSVYEKQQAEVVNLQAKLVSGLSTQEHAICSVTHELERLRSVPKELSSHHAALKALETRIASVEKNSTETAEKQAQRILARVEVLEEESAKGQRAIRAELGELNSEAARRQATIEGEVEACRRQMAEVQTASADCRSAQSNLEERLDDIVAFARAQIEHQITSAALRLQQHVEAESRQVENELREMTSSLKERGDAERWELAEEYRNELESTLDDMKGALNVEIHHSCRELSMMLSTWKDGLLKATDSWVAHLETRQFDAAAPPSIARDAASEYCDAMHILSQQLPRLSVNAISGSGLDARWNTGTRPPIHPSRHQDSRPWKPPSAGRSRKP